MSTHKIDFNEELTKLSFNYHQLYTFSLLLVTSLVLWKEVWSHVSDIMELLEIRQ